MTLPLIGLVPCGLWVVLRLARARRSTGRVGRRRLVLPTIRISAPESDARMPRDRGARDDMAGRP